MCNPQAGLAPVTVDLRRYLFAPATRKSLLFPISRRPVFQKKIKNLCSSPIDILLSAVRQLAYLQHSMGRYLSDDRCVDHSLSPQNTKSPEQRTITSSSSSSSSSNGWPMTRMCQCLDPSIRQSHNTCHAELGLRMPFPATPR